MKSHVGVLTRKPYRHPGGKVAYCTMSTMGEDIELVVFRKQSNAYQALLSLDKGDIVEIRGNKQIDTYNGNTTKQLIVQELAKDELPDKLEEEAIDWESIDAI